MCPPKPASRKVVPGKAAPAPTSGGKSTKLGSQSAAVTASNQILKQRPPSATPLSDILPDLGLKRAVNSAYSTNDYGQIEELPPLTSVSEDKFNELLQQKLQQCRIICNFVDPMADLKSKTTKQGYLQEILDHISQPKYFKLIDQDSFRVFFSMIKSNLIRAIPPLPALARVPMIGDDVNDTIFESSWVHLELVYDIFRRFLESSLLEASQFAMYIDQAFVARFLKLFNTPDQREREQLKIILHRLYLKFVQQRPLIRQSIQHIFLTYIYEDRYFCGIAELLDIIISIVNGYGVPLKQENVDFLVKILLPLHTSNFLHLFHSNLFYCVMQYIQKDPKLIPDVIQGLFHLWPVSCSLKELIFVEQISRILELVSEEQFVELSKQLFHKIGECIASNNFQVSERGMLLWRNDRFHDFTKSHAKELFPVICPYLYRTGTAHWNTAIKNLAVSVIRICMEGSPEVFEAFSRTMKVQEQQELENQRTKTKTWKLILASAMANDANARMNEAVGHFDVIFPKDGK
jgi:serine/threonine-protein phosphatase 2A regulatory subunit B'